MQMRVPQLAVHPPKHKPRAPVQTEVRSMEVCTVLVSASSLVCWLPPTIDTSGKGSRSLLKVNVVLPAWEWSTTRQFKRANRNMHKQ